MTRPEMVLFVSISAMWVTSMVARPTRYENLEIILSGNNNGTTVLQTCYCSQIWSVFRSI